MPELETVQVIGLFQKQRRNKMLRLVQISQDASIGTDFEFQIKSAILEDAWKSANIGSLHASNVA